MPPGTYEIRIVAKGFTAFEAKDIAIQPNNIARVDAVLKVGSVTEVVVVGAEAVALQTDKSDLHTDIESRALTTLSVGGYRNYQSLLDLVPGTTPGQFQNASTDSPSRALTTNVNGTARNSNNTRIDGAASVFTWLPHHSYYVPAIESIETVNISTNNFDAEQGMSGGAAVNVITKSGTNHFMPSCSSTTPTTCGAQKISSSIRTRPPVLALRSESTTSTAAPLADPSSVTSFSSSRPGKEPPPRSAVTAS